MLTVLLTIYLVGLAFCAGWRGKEVSLDPDIEALPGFVIVAIYSIIWPVSGTGDVIRKLKEMGFTWDRIKNCR